MVSQVSGGDGRITILNSTRSSIWVAVYCRSALRNDEAPIAWQVESVPSRATTAISAPRDYQIFARYCFKPEAPRQPVYQTNTRAVLRASAGAGFVIESISTPDRCTWGAVLIPAAQEPEWYRVRIVNRFPLGVWTHVRQGGRDVFSPRVLPPGSSGIEDLDSPLYVVVLALPRAAGDLLLNTEVAATEIVVEAGESVKVQGGPRKGFKISKLSLRALPESLPPARPLQAPPASPRPPTGRRRSRSRAAGHDSART